MAGIGLEIRVDPGGAAGALRGVEAAISDASLEVFLGERANRHLQERAQARFTNEGDDVSGKWQQLTPATVSIRESQGFGGAHPINKRTGALENYIVNSAGRLRQDGAGVSLVTPGDTPDGELSLKLAMAQGGGISKSGSSVPARPVLGMNAEDDVILVEMLKVHIETAIASHGLA